MTAVVQEHTRWGPFVPAISHGEMLSRLRTLRAFVQCYVKREHPIHDALCDAESGEPADLELARIEFDRLPALKQRDILGSYAKHWQRKSQREKRRAANAEGV
jgi:hypothetical protein